jgi:predicted DNA-binding transcriptional regulator AlpA
VKKQYPRAGKPATAASVVDPATAAAIRKAVLAELEITAAAPEYLRADRAATFIDVSTPTLWRYVEAGLLPRPKKISRRVSVFAVKDLRRLIAKAHGVARGARTRGGALGRDRLDRMCHGPLTDRAAGPAPVEANPEEHLQS